MYLVRGSAGVLSGNTEQERKTGRLPADWEYTLPTEAQWERACRGGTDTTFSFGDNAADLASHAWFEETATRARENYPHAVGQKKPNAWGLHDMHGNVAEWCRDYFSLTLRGGRNPEVTRPDANPHRIIRGGWYYSKAEDCRPTARRLAPADFWNGQFGFRVALTPIQPADDNPAK